MGFDCYFFDLFNYVVEVGVMCGNVGFKKIKCLLVFFGKVVGDGVIMV